MSLISNYPGGFANGVSVRGMPIFEVFGGNVFWVSSRGGSNGNKGTRDRPFATLDYAIGRCTANNGDIIMVMPDHAETITGAGGITADVAGIRIIGMGHYNQRPRFLMDGADTVDVAVSAADVAFHNLVFAAGHADVVRCFNITAKGCWLDGVEFEDHTTDENWLTPIKATSTSDNNADGLMVTNCRWISPDAGCLEFVEINANLNGFVAHNNFVSTAGTASPFLLSAGTKNLTGMSIVGNYLRNAMTANDLAWDNGGSGNSGVIAHNRIRHADVTGAHALGAVAGGVGFFDNLSVSVDNLSGFVLPAIDVDL